MRKPKTSRGKQKIEIKKIEAEDARLVCFSKRKHGIFSKASELATLCGAKAAIIIESPGGRPYTFGSPSFGHVIDVFLQSGMSSTGVDLNKPQWLPKVEQLNINLMQLSSNLHEARKKRATLISKIADLSKQNEDVWRIENAQDINLTELKKAKDTLERFMERIKNKMVKQTELGLSENDLDPGHGKSIRLDLNLSPDGNFDHVAQMNPYIKSNASDAGPSKPCFDLNVHELPY